jgi:hypothetical protein
MAPLRASNLVRPDARRERLALTLKKRVDKYFLKCYILGWGGWQPDASVTR